MSKYYSVSNSILLKTPAQRRTCHISDIRWIAKNIKLTPLERKEIVAILKEAKK